MELRVLKYFLAVAQEENLTRAAKTLLTSQSNLSRQLADLENELGKKLFKRGSRKITLTEEGLYLHKRAKEIIELAERTENELIHIGCPIPFDIDAFLGQLEELMEAAYKNVEDIRERVEKVVSTYHQV